MIKYFCDSCSAEIKSPNTVEVPCHLYSLKGNGAHGYVDSAGIPVSGRRDTLHLCNKCWNVGYSALLKAIGLPKDNNLKR